jgi:alpha-L-fucosidase
MTKPTSVAGLIIASLVAAGSSRLGAQAAAPAASIAEQEEAAATRNATPSAPPVSTTPPAAGARAGRGGGGGGRNEANLGPIVAAAEKASPALPPGPYQATWESLSTHPIPAWYKDARFGVSMHWGLYSVPAHGSEWYVRNMVGDRATYDWHVQKFGPVDKFGYKDFIPLFTAAKFNPDEWMALLKKAGVKYFVPSAEHHDGFSLWDSAYNPWNAKAMGPHRDLIGELAVAARKAGIKFGVTNHSLEHFNFINPLPEIRADLEAKKADMFDKQWAGFYSVADRGDDAHQKFLTVWVEKNFELIDKYQLDLLWWDNGVNSRAYDPLKLKVSAYLYNRAKERGQEAAMLTKGEASLGGHVEDYERLMRTPAVTAPATIPAATFETQDSPGVRWGYIEGDHYQGVGWALQRLVESACRNGNFLLNLGPKPDGTIPDEQKALLLGIGQWLDINGEAIYGTRAWTKPGEGNLAPGRYTAKDIRFTTKGDTLYSIFLSWPGEEGTVTSLATGVAPAGKITSVTLLGNSGELAFTQDATGLHVKFPATKPGDNFYALKITGLKLK